MRDWRDYLRVNSPANNGILPAAIYADVWMSKRDNASSTLIVGGIHSFFVRRTLPLSGSIKKIDLSSFAELGFLAVSSVLPANKINLPSAAVRRESALWTTGSLLNTVSKTG